ncbi:HlyD family efflux transporter periplasmic adaptor subunit [Halomonas alkaliantarctica]|uniref:HlyD family efflux transporter periplasmic adaptor subunit n=1 Tax=Halomonas alkaliantarctica TaxID=232346 RepID=A0ABY8LPP3_9GAMM|nr:HlyD family efflux transporter periplasmic adaptor subunit [Halomonas alkaliantarctica]WGI26386.1 HlyD family efflux transporter periplasmic adaptor subunit [Halomonas alkaliantarctica]
MKTSSKGKLIKSLVALAAISIVAWFVWWELQPDGLGEGITGGNGRIEATEIDIATRVAGRLDEVLVEEGEFVEAGQVVARMDTATLEADLAQARAQTRRAENALETARAMVAMRQSELETARAVVNQRQAELNASRKRYERSSELVERNAISRQQFDDTLADYQSHQAALASANSQVLSAQAAIRAAESQVIEAESDIDATQAAIQRIEADLDDSELKINRLARVQYRVAEPGEVLGAGGKVLNLIDLTKVYMTFFLPTREAGQVAIGDEVRLVLDAAPDYVIPARVSFVASTAQFTPKTVETESEREKLMFRVRAQINPDLLLKHINQVKTGLPGMAYLKIEEEVSWPDYLEVNVSP